MVLASNSTSLNLSPITGSRTHPEPFPPVIDTEITLSMSKSWGSTKTFFTVPVIIGSTKAVTPVPGDDIEILGGLIIS